MTIDSKSNTIVLFVCVIALKLSARPLVAHVKRVCHQMHRAAASFRTGLEIMSQVESLHEPIAYRIAIMISRNLRQSGARDNLLYAKTHWLLVFVEKQYFCCVRNG